MTYEVELKFRVDSHDRVRAALAELGTRPGETVRQCDRYFNHPARDFAQSNEALRVRSLGERCVVTYKGPVLDKAVKTRREIELPIGTSADDGDEFAEMLTLLGFRPVRAVEKTRETFHLDWHGVAMELAVDTVAGLGAFVEIETLADDSNRAERQAAVLSLAARLGLDEPERRSYLTMLLQQDAGAGTPPAAFD